jgi:O-antigen/teichoic acid export membrane protein/ribosomal protein L40E
VKTFVYRWFKANKVLLANVSSLVGTYVITSALGFVYWIIAARYYPAQSVGIASAANSAMTLIGLLSIFGLGTLLIGELQNHPGKEAGIISAALILVATVGGGVAIVFAYVAPFFSAELQPLRASLLVVLIFAAGVSFHAVTQVFDQSLIGLLRGDLQLWRNTIFAIVKLLILACAGLWLASKAGIVIYATWAAGNAFSLLALGIFVIGNGAWRKIFRRPQWGFLRGLKSAALEHHTLNLIIQVPALALPLIVTVMLSATKNAWFYASFMLANMAFMITYSVTTVLFATSASQVNVLVSRIRVTIGIALLACTGANIVLWLGAKELLGLFGHSYADEAQWSLRILSLVAFPIIIKYHFVALARIEKRIARVLLPMVFGTLFELVAAATGAYMAGLTGLSLGWLIAVTAEGVMMFPTVYKAVRLKNLYIEIKKYARAFPPLSSMERQENLKELEIIHCFRCNTDLPVQAHFCRKCGAHIDDMKEAADFDYDDRTLPHIRVVKKSEEVLEDDNETLPYVRAVKKTSAGVGNGSK